MVLTSFSHFNTDEKYFSKAKRQNYSDLIPCETGCRAPSEVQQVNLSLTRTKTKIKYSMDSEKKKKKGNIRQMKAVQ